MEPDTIDIDEVVTRLEALVNELELMITLKVVCTAELDNSLATLRQLLTNSSYRYSNESNFGEKSPQPCYQALSQ